MLSSVLYLVMAVIHLQFWPPSLVFPFLFIHMGSL